MRAAVGAATSLSSKRAVRRAQTSDVALFSFYDLSGRCSSKGLGVLIGWRRQPRRADAPSLSRLPSGDAFDRAHSRKGNGANHFSLGRAAFTALSAGARAAGDAHEAVVPNAQAHPHGSTANGQAGGGGPTVNPPNKEVRLEWVASDELILMSCGGGMGVEGRRASPTPNAGALSARV